MKGLKLPFVSPVADVVAPLKEQAIARAEKEATLVVLKVWKALTEAGWDLNVAAPYPRANRMSQLEYKQKVSRYHLFASLVETVSSRSMADPHIVKPSERRETVYIEKCKEMAAAQYDAFVQKLVSKIGPCDSATLNGSHVWGYSILTVSKGPTVERWKTQQIVNQSGLGTVFNQWPTRLLKGGR
jgi:hypothetical protein